MALIIITIVLRIWEWQRECNEPMIPQSESTAAIKAGIMTVTLCVAIAAVLLPSIPHAGSDGGNDSSDTHYTCMFVWEPMLPHS